MRVGIFSSTSDRTKGHNLKLHQRRFRLDIGRSVFTIKGDYVLKWAAGEAVESLTLEVCKERLQVVRGTRCHGLVDKLLLGHRLDSMTSRIFSNLTKSVIL